MAHGYLLHRFLSPLSSTREDDYGGSLERKNEISSFHCSRLLKRTIPDDYSTFCAHFCCRVVLIGGWQMSDSIQFARQLKQLGVDVIDCSSGW